MNATPSIDSLLAYPQCFRYPVDLPALKPSTNHPAPSLLDVRSLDPVDRSLALKDWIEKRKVRTQRRELVGPVKASQSAR